MSELPAEQGGEVRPEAASGAGGGQDELPGGLGAVDLLAAALRSGAQDLSSYERVLFKSLAESLPAGVVEVRRERSMADRVAGRPGRATAISVHLGDETLEIAERRGSTVASVARDVRGVTISRREVSLAEWSEHLAEQLARFAEKNSAARDAILRLLGAG